MVRNCKDFPGMKAEFKHQRQIQLFSPSGLLEFIEIDILGPLLLRLPRTRSGNQFVVLNTDRYSTLARAVPPSQLSSTHVAHIFINNWVVTYGLPDIMQSDNGQNVCHRTLYLSLSVSWREKFTTTAYHPQTNGKAELYNRTLVLRL